MDFKKTRIKQIEVALETTRKRFKSLAENNFEELEDFKVQAVADGLNLLDDYFEGLKNNEDPDVENLKREYNRLMDEMSKTKQQ
jgi:hypothetical protein